MEPKTSGLLVSELERWENDRMTTTKRSDGGRWDKEEEEEEKKKMKRKRKWSQRNTKNKSRRGTKGRVQVGLHGTILSHATSITTRLKGQFQPLSCFLFTSGNDKLNCLK